MYEKVSDLFFMEKYCLDLYHAQDISVQTDTSIHITFSQELLFCRKKYRLKRVRVLKHLQIHIAEILAGNFYSE